MRGKNFLQMCKKLPSISTLSFKFNPSADKKFSVLASNTLNFDGNSENFDSSLSNQFMLLLKSCYGPLDLHKGRQIHAQIISNGVNCNVLHTRALGMYVLCENLLGAKEVFFRVNRGSALPWNWMIRGFTMMGLFDFALVFYFKMWVSGTLPDKFTYPYVIKACCGLRALNLGRMIHDTIYLFGFEENLFVGSSLIKLYTENNSIGEAREVFDRMPERDCVLWNVMIDGYVRIRDIGNAVGIFNSMRISDTRPNSVSVVHVLSISASEAMLEYGTQLHGLVIRCGMDLEALVANTLLAMYSKCRCLSDVSKLFSLMPQNDLVAWNGMISGYVQNGLNDEAVDLFHRMQRSGVKPDSVTFCSFLPSFTDAAGLNQGKEIHAYILRNGVVMDAFLKSALIDIYLKSKGVKMAQMVFESTKTVDIVIYSAMISGYVLNGLNSNALGMFRQLIENQIKPNAIAMASVLPACSSLTTLRLGREMHGYILKNVFDGRCYVASSLMDMYAKCGRLDLSHQIFSRMSEKDVVAWNSMISRFTQNGKLEETFHLLRQMGSEGMIYDHVTMSSALSACANLPSLGYGKECHGYITRCGLGSDLFVESTLLDMYAKCGHLVLARRVFDSMTEKNEVSWNSIISAYGAHGLINDTENLFLQMEEVGCKPDHITFLNLISACSHAGTVEEGLRFFHCMREKYGIVARMEHYACMIDMFGRAGRMAEALHFIMDMPFKPDAGIWGAVLGGCRVHGNVEIAEIASKHLFELDPQNSGYYILMSNVNAAAGRWEGVSELRSLMKERRVQKVPGYSWIDINNICHMFVFADKSHPDTERIYLCMKSLIFELEEEGYVHEPSIYASITHKL